MFVTVPLFVLLLTRSSLCSPCTFFVPLVMSFVALRVGAAWWPKIMDVFWHMFSGMHIHGLAPHALDLLSHLFDHANELSKLCFGLLDCVDIHLWQRHPLLKLELCFNQ